MNTTVFYSATTGGFYPGAPYGNVGDEVEISPQQHADLIAGQASGKLITLDARGYPVLGDPPPPSPEQVELARTQAVQRELDAAARARRYVDLADAISYANEPAVARFQVEGQAFRVWRSQVWEHVHAIFDQVEAGARSMPEQDELIASLPVLHIPSV
ncbi:hypothetical protein [Bordetella genomosp. 1]|uniref:Phage tail protein n=1 Tax=Bordetella genomosp. 1 TaxID=1395607 RepID=A0ABX4EUH7_9BORD|nr:hypothetical protein [Bordetella genomosp. 1]OZI57862.1 hypothetical protein CAL27_20905 [Bordetella genomosp. 1]